MDAASWLESLRDELGRGAAHDRSRFAIVPNQFILDVGGGAPFEDGDDRGRVLISGASTGDRYSLMELTVAARDGEVGFGGFVKEATAHFHSHFE